MKNLKYFMRPADEQIITIPAPASFVDDEGKPLMMEVKRMPQSKIEEINAAYRTRTVATDKNHMPLVQNGEVVG